MPDNCQFEYLFDIRHYINQRVVFIAQNFRVFGFRCWYLSLIHILIESILIVIVIIMLVMGLRAGVLIGSSLIFSIGGTPVSYTHLDVYKRQAPPYLLIVSTSSSGTEDEP